MAKDYSKYFVKPDMKASKKRSSDDVDVVYANIDEQFIGLGNGKNYYIRTYGCQMNEHDTEVMAGILTKMGFSETKNVEDATVVIFNTCAIRENAENKVFGEIGRLSSHKRNNPDMIFAVCGCMSQEEGVVEKLLTKYRFIDMIFGTHNIHRLPELLNTAMFSKERVVEVWSQEGEIIENLPKTRASNKQAWVNIIYGCDKFCTYCIVPYTRGSERSRLHNDIIKEVEELVEAGYVEVTLLGQNVNAYGKDLKNDYTLANLLEDVAKTGIKRLRFTTSHPWDFDDEMIEIIAKYDNIMPHVHLPVQSGNDEILKIMGRGYTREQYLTLFNKLKKAKPTMHITTDIIVGYPNETDEQFLETLSLYEYCQYDNAFTFLYSPREGTPAAKMVDNIPFEVKKERLNKLNELVKKYAKSSHAKFLDQTVKVFVTGVSNKNSEILAGYTEFNQLVVFPGGEHLIGEIVDVKIIETRLHNLVGELSE